MNRAQKLRALVLGALVLAAASITWLHGYLHSSSGSASSASFRASPRFKLKSSDGVFHALEELADQAVVVHFWASWCPPCLGEIPQWLEFAGRWKGRPVRFVAISLDRNWDDALKILPDRELPANVISLLDEAGKLPDDFGTYQYPETYLLDREHRIVTKWVGPQDWNSPKIQVALERALR